MSANQNKVMSPSSTVHQMYQPTPENPFLQGAAATREAPDESTSTPAAPSNNPTALPSSPSITATYRTPSSIHTFDPPSITSTPSPSSSSTTTNQSSLSSVDQLTHLRTALPILQASINTFLTQKMEEDTAVAQLAGRVTGADGASQATEAERSEAERLAQKEKERKEDELYGEEVVDGDDY